MKAQLDAIAMIIPTLTTIEIEFNEQVAELCLNRPGRSNALNEAMWRELRIALRWADDTAAVRAVVLRGHGANFCSGIDLGMLASVATVLPDGDSARRNEALRRLILDLQDTLSCAERCRKPVLAAVHGACLGAGVDLLSCCDMRYASADARFAVREIDLGMVADVGTLQRLPRLVPDGVARELSFTGRDLGAEEALTIGFVNKVFESPDALTKAVRELARIIAAKSPLAIRGTKEMLNYGRDHSVADGLNYVATWNAAMLMSADLAESMNAVREKRLPDYKD